MPRIVKAIIFALLLLGALSLTPKLAVVHGDGGDPLPPICFPPNCH